MELIEYKDLYGIYHRIKEIRPSYKLFLNRKTNKVELYDTNFGGKCMTFNLPILPNIIDKINSTRIENANVIFRKMQDNNSKNAIKNVQNVINNANMKFF